jgi:regulatory protein
MAKITALRQNKGRRRVNVFLDGSFAFSLSADRVASEGLQVDQTLNSEQVNALSGSDGHDRCLTAATRLLSYRPRSSSELRTILQRRGFDRAAQDSTLATLKEKTLVDDAAFARFWTENRESFSPRSQRLTGIELKRKGVPADIIEQAVASIDDEASAHRAALAHLGSMRWSDRDQFRRRLGGYLQRRGFAYAVVEATLARLWHDTLIESKTSTNGIEDRYATTDLKEGR